MTFVLVSPRVIAVGITDQVDMAEIEVIASTRQDVITVDDFATLSAALDNLVQTACSNIPTLPPPPPPTGNTQQVEYSYIYMMYENIFVEKTCKLSSDLPIMEIGTPAENLKPFTMKWSWGAEGTFDWLFISGNCHAVLDLGFVIDSSGSIKDADPGNWDVLLNFVRNVINRFTIGPEDVRVGAVVYSNNVR